MSNFDGSDQKSDPIRFEPGKWKPAVSKYFEEINCCLERDCHLQKQPPRRFSKYIMFFFSRSNLFTIFQKGLNVCRTDSFLEDLSKRHVFSRRVYLFVKQTLSSHRTDTNFPKNFYLILEQSSIFSLNRYSFSRKPYLDLEHILLSRRLLCLEQIDIFQESSPLSNRLIR